ncbi:MAG: prepilin-type N-terminal cleavage/methylation domain-containing protein [Deltaproteobacteria bacterium]|nr:prepilin-type N-terminal cleavage/methylation domain-containing protein [Deltaproteobacteria bacterium]
MTGKKASKGFTLLEVMIAITIMTIAFAAILTSQSGAITLTTKTKELNMSAWLARNIMIDSEHLFEGKPFSELPKEESQAFPAPFERYKWTREIREIQLPEFSFSKGEEGVPEAVRILAKVVTKFLNGAIRELVVTVTWKRGEGEYKVQLSTYLVDLNAAFDFQI